MPPRDRRYTGPHHLRTNVVMVDRATALRVMRVYDELGRREASRALGVGESTVEAAMEEGRLMRRTHERLVEGLTRWEAGKVS